MEESFLKNKAAQLKKGTHNVHETRKLIITFTEYLNVLYPKPDGSNPHTNPLISILISLPVSAFKAAGCTHRTSASFRQVADAL
jgi:hypothetical protein